MQSEKMYGMYLFTVSTLETFAVVVLRWWKPATQILLIFIIQS